MCFPGLMVKMVKTVTVRRLGRRVRGMMYYRKALELQAFLDMAKDEELMKGYKALELTSEDASKSGKSLWEPQRGKPVLLVSLLERAAEVVKNSNDGLWRASFDEFFTLLTKYCRSKYETIHGQNQENAAAEVFEAAIKREMPAELLRASLRHTSEDQQNFLLNFGRKGFSSPPVSELKTGARSSQVNSEECGKGFTSSKALCGHMACHFEREKRVSCSHFFQVKKSAKSSVISHQSRTYVVITCVGQEECKVIFCISVTGNAYVLTLVVLYSCKLL
ncbi:hypothetical protein Bca101_006141 [Brassica carinata]